MKRVGRHIMPVPEVRDLTIRLTGGVIGVTLSGVDCIRRWRATSQSAWTPTSLIDSVQPQQWPLRTCMQEWWCVLFLDLVTDSLERPALPGFYSNRSSDDDY